MPPSRSFHPRNFHPRNLNLNPLFTFIEFIASRVSRLFYISDEWTLAFILHVELAWVICTIVMTIGFATKAPWRPSYGEYSDQGGFKRFAVAFAVVSELWFRCLMFSAFFEVISFLVWFCFGCVAFWNGRRVPTVLPLINQIFLGLGLDLLPVLRSHYR